MPGRVRRAPGAVHRAAARRAGPAAVAVALLVLACCPPAVATAGGDRPVPAGEGVCGRYPARPIEGTPWALRRLLLGQLWRYGKGGGVRVAVIDSGVDDRNPQLRGAVDTRDGVDLIGSGDGTDDTDGHGTEVAGVIAARPAAGTGFVGLAPAATVIPIRQTDGGSAGTVQGLAAAIHDAVTRHARVINISQDATEPDPALRTAVEDALAHDVVVVAAAGNDGSGGARHTTYPAAYPGVLAVGASDRDDARASFSQAGPFVGVAAPGVDMVSTVPLGGQCVDSGTSFAAPYVAGVAALIRGKHPGWTGRQVVAQIEQTADRPGRGRTDALGWGVVDPVRALTDDGRPQDRPVPDPPPALGAAARPVGYPLDGGARQRTVRDALCAVAVAVVALGVIAGGAVTARDARRRR